MFFEFVCWLVPFFLAASQDGPAQHGPVASVRLLAVGDVNIGRYVGRRIVQGDTLYPFMAVRDSIQAYDVVFANLESNLSDQNGETEDPHNNLVFTGPPAGAQTLRRAGITVVSTANNHALDYGKGAHRQTMELLEDAGILFAGTSGEPDQLHEPVFVTHNGVRIALFAVTDVMNATGSAWRRFVAAADTAALFPRIRQYRDSVDFVIVSYHGGAEYVQTPSQRTRKFAHGALEAGADLFLGHHPHVPQVVERVGEKYIAYSLGNFVFEQPSRYWTRHSIAFSGIVQKEGGHARITDVQLLPVRCGFQPEFLYTGSDAEKILARVGTVQQAGIQEASSW